MNILDIKVKNLGKLKDGTVKVRPLTVLTGENGTGKSFFTKTLYSVFNIVNKNLLYIEATNNIRMSSLGIDFFDKSLTRKGKEDKKNIQLLKLTLNELQSLLMDMKDYSIGAYIQTRSTTTDTQIKNFNRFIEYLTKLEKKQKIKSVSYPSNILRKSFSVTNFEIISNGGLVDLVFYALS
jgi:predicted ATPase